MKSALGIFALLVMTAGFAVAAPAVQRLTLKDAIDMALEKNHLIRAAGFKAKAAQQRIGIVRSRYYPGLFFEETFAATNSPTQAFMMKLDEGRFAASDLNIGNLNHPAAWHDFKTALTLQQPLFAPSVLPAREMAEKDAEMMKLDVAAAREEVAFQVFQLYLDIQRATAQFKAADLTVTDAREHMRLAEVRRKEGNGLRSDELRARTLLSAAQEQHITALNNLTLAKMHLAVTIGLEDEVRLETSEPATALAVVYSAADLARIAQESRNELKQHRVGLEKSEASLQLARNAYLPTVDAFASYQLNAKDTPFGSDNDSWMAGVNLKWQIFDGFRRNRERDLATAERSAAAELLESGASTIAYQVRESYLRREEMGKRLEVARHALLDAEETVRLLSKRYENSLATMAELLDAQTALNQARSILVNNEANYALAVGRVYYSAGIFLKEIIR